MPTPSRYTLITNLDYVTVRDVRTFTHALLLITEEHPLQRGTPRHLLRGFSTTPSVPTFDVVIPTATFTLEDAASHSMVTLRAGDSKPTPLMHGAIMHIPDFGEVHLIAGVNSETGLDIKCYADGTEISQVWNDLERKVAEHWTAPNIMEPCWIPIRMRRESRK